MKVRAVRAGEGGRLHAMWVAPTARGQGAAQALCDACATWAAAHGATTLTLAVFETNAAARRAYEAAGFTFRTRDRRELILTRPL